MLVATRFRAVLLTTAGLLLVPVGIAQQRSFKADAAQSKVNFTLVGNVHTVDGSFQLQQGDVSFDDKTGTMSGSIVVGAGTGHSGSDARDRRMTESVLEAPKFTVATFEPKKMHGMVAANGDSEVQVDGIFTVHGASHDLTVPMQIHIEGGRVTAKTHFVVPYVKWGMKDPSTFVFRVNKDVDIDLTLVGGIVERP